jgi:hypothetical protein
MMNNLGPKTGNAALTPVEGESIISENKGKLGKKKQ